MKESAIQQWIDDPDNSRLINQERLIVDATEEIWEAMETRTRTKSALATALGKSKAFVTQTLNGTRNMTLRTLADFATALDYTVEIKLKAKDSAMLDVVITPEETSSAVAWQWEVETMARIGRIKPPKVVEGANCKDWNSDVADGCNAA